MSPHKREETNTTIDSEPAGEASGTGESIEGSWQSLGATPENEKLTEGKRQTWGSVPVTGVNDLKTAAARV